MTQKDCENCKLAETNGNLVANCFLLGLILVFAFSAMIIQKRKFNVKIDALRKDNIHYKQLLDSKPDLPQWYVDAYVKCTTDTPANFRKDCLIYEINRAM